MNQTAPSPRFHLLGASEKVARLLLWGGLILPVAFGPNESSAQILAHGLSMANVVRGGLPIVALIIAWVLVRAQPSPLSTVEWLIVAFCGVALLSTIWSIVPWTTALKAVSLALGYATIFLIARLHARHRQDSIMALAVLAQAVVLPALLAVIVVPGRALVTLGPDPTLRLQGLLPQASADSLAYLGAVGIILLASGWRPPTPRADLVALALATVDLIAMLLSRTRTALILLLIGLMVVYGRHILSMINSSARSIGTAVAAAAALVLIVGLTVIPGSPVAHFVLRGQTVEQMLTLTGRINTWSNALSVWSHRPLQGYGYYAGHRFGVPMGHGASEVSNLDNAWVEALVDTGLFGAGLLALAITAGFLNLVMLWRRDRHVDRARLALLVIAILASFVNPSLELYSYQMIVLALVLIGYPRPPPLRIVAPGRLRGDRFEGTADLAG